MQVSTGAAVSEEQSATRHTMMDLALPLIEHIDEGSLQLLYRVIRPQIKVSGALALGLGAGRWGERGVEWASLARRSAPPFPGAGPSPACLCYPR